MRENPMHRTTTQKKERYQNDPEYREVLKERVRTYQQRPDVKTRKLESNRKYMDKIKRDPILREIDLEKRRESQRNRRADPEYRAKKNEQSRTRRKLVPKEAVIESYLKERVEAAKGMCIKFIDPGRRGAPDRLVTLLGHPTYFVELKRPHLGQLDPLQVRYHERLRACGQRVWVLNSKKAVDDFMVEILV